ncbi:MAG: STAS domain-containing protein [Spirochaetales bacterium]|nr:STAS domain-containing protein [Spirochaetales bacterium]
MRYIDKKKSSEEIVVEVSGTLMGMEATEFFQKLLENQFTSDYKIITLNFKDVDAINSSCIGKIFLFQKKLEEKGRRIQIKGCSDSLLKTFQLIKLEQLISIES